MKFRRITSQQRWIYYVLVLSLISLTLHSEASVTDSLRQAMNNARVPSEKMRTAVLLAEELIPQDMDSALVLLDFAAPLLNGQNDLYKSEYLNQRGIYHWYNGEYYESISWFRKTLQLPNEKQLLPQLAAASNNIGTLFRFLGQPDSAGIYLEKALKIDEARNYKSGMAKTLYDLGALYRQTNKYQLALINTQRAMDIVLQGNDTSMIVHVLTVLGNIYVELDSIPLAVESHMKAMQYAEDAGIKEMIGVGHNNFCAIYCDLPSEFDKTAYHFDKGMNIARELSDYPLMVSLNNNMGNAWRARSDFSQAMFYYQKAKSLLEFSVEPIRETDLYFNIGQTFKSLQVNDSARIYLAKCLETAQQIESLKYQSEALLEMAVIDSLDGNFLSAFELYQKGISLRDSIWNNQHRSRIVELQIIYETQKNKLYIKDLERRQKLNRTIIFLIITSTTFGLISLITLIFYLHKKRITSNRLLIIQKQENERAQTDLETKRRELAERVHVIVTHEEFLNSLEKKIQTMIKSADQQCVDALESVLVFMNKKEKSDDSWNEFLKHFDELNDDFISRMIAKYPSLSPFEVRLCAMLRLNMSTKEIADLSKRAIRTIEFYRTSIRKKMGLQNSENLSTYLAKL